MSTGACNVCGKTSTLMRCSRCKSDSVAYCSPDCQRQDWKDHKRTCKRKEFAVAPCDCCGSMEDVYGNMCFNCGSLYCNVCNDQNCTLDLSGQVASFAPCIRCHKRRDLTRSSDCKKLEKLIKESPRDPRLTRWHLVLGYLFLKFDKTRRGEQKAKAHFLRAGELGSGEGFTCAAEIYATRNRNWDEARRYLQKGADLMNVYAIDVLAREAHQGYFQFGEIMQEDARREPDVVEAFRLYQDGARLGHAPCCVELAHFYHNGYGTEVNLVKAFKWAKKAAEMGDAHGMWQCATFYHYGEGIEQSNDHAIYWYEKSLKLLDNEDARTNLQMLRGLSTGSS